MQNFRPVMRALLFLSIFCTAAAAVAQNRVLLPIYLAADVPGAQGSVWRSQFAVHNNSTRTYTLHTCTAATPDEVCAIDTRVDEVIIPGETKTVLPERYPTLPNQGVGGAILTFESDTAPSTDISGLSFNLRVLDVSRSAIAAGTEVPVIRETNFRKTTAELLNIPVDPRFRLALRILAITFSSADFMVRVVDQQTNTVVSESRRQATVPPGGTIFSPAFAEINDLAVLAPAGSTFRVEVAPLTAGAAFWTYVSVTNNESQQITLITPQ